MRRGGKGMPTTPLLPLPDGLEITSSSESADELLVRVTSNRSHSPCPLCATPSQAIHSYYRRKPLDLPCTGRPIRLLLTVKKFFCRVASCPRKIFTERIPALLHPSSRLTTRLRSAVQEVGFASCGKGGERLCSKLGMQISDTTLLWSVQLVPTPDVEGVRIVGLDDWAWRRGHKYGTIIVDLETRRVIDVLPDRCAESVQKWLEAHEEREIVSRDRGNVYLDGATQGAPLAQQVSDRWHLCKNIGDAVEEFLQRTRIRLPEHLPPEPPEEPVQVQVIPLSLSPSEIRQAERSQELLARRQERCDQVKALHALGVSWRSTNTLDWIARRSGNISALRGLCNHERVGGEPVSSIPTTTIFFCAGGKAVTTDNSCSMKSEPKAIQEVILWFEPWSHVYARICLSEHRRRGHHQPPFGRPQPHHVSCAGSWQNDLKSWTPRSRPTWRVCCKSEKR